MKIETSETSTPSCEYLEAQDRLFNKTYTYADMLECHLFGIERGENRAQSKDGADFITWMRKNHDQTAT